MADKSNIEWTDATWNPTTGCDRVSPGCANCYALTLAARLKKMGAPAYQRDGDPRTSGPGFGLTLHPDRLEVPVRWTRPRRIFVNSMSDLFHPDVPFEYVDDVWDAMRRAPQHQFQILTKRPDRQLEYAAGRVADDDTARIPMAELVLPNVWLGTSVENDRWTVRADALRLTPAAVRFISAEPLLGPLTHLNLEGIDWLIVGGESGPGHRPMQVEWVEEIAELCDAAGTALFVKQDSGPRSGQQGRIPPALWARKEFPNGTSH